MINKNKERYDMKEYGEVFSVVDKFFSCLYEKDIKSLKDILDSSVMLQSLKNDKLIKLDYNEIANMCNEYKGQYYEIKLYDISNTVASAIIKSSSIYLLQIIKINGYWKIINIISEPNPKFNINNEKQNFMVESENFIIKFNSDERTCINEIIGLLESRYKIITKNLKQEVSGKTCVKICSNSHELQSALGLENAPEWIRGGVKMDTTVIASPINPPKGSDFYNVLNTVVHEFVHVIINQINNDTPRWLNEGVASYEGKDNSEEWIKKTIRKSLEENTLPKLKDLDTGRDFAKFFEIDGYQFSYTIIEFIVNKFGYEKLHDFLEEPDNFEGIFNMSENEFESNWGEFLKKNY